MQDKINLTELIKHIDPASCDYTEWVTVGMALKLEGYSCSVWDDWSRSDPKRYRSGECEKKWETFGGSASPVTGGSIYQLAVEHGYVPPVGAVDEEMNWDDCIARDPLKIIEGVEIQPLKIPENRNPKQQLITYLETLFEPDDYVGYVTECWQNSDGKFFPSRGSFDRTAGQLIGELTKLDNNDIGAVLGDYNPEVGAWIRFNPLDGQGVKNNNVTDFRYALVESDQLDIETQNSIIRELELPVAALVYSGGKSIHAIVRVDAANAREYADRVKYLYSVCQRNGFSIDTQNKNPSRLSRMPGVTRGEKAQCLLDVNIGRESWASWYEYIESVNDDLPDFENLADIDFDNLPELSEPLIDGILRKGHKMLVTGPSKAGKSFALIELAVAIAEGESWFGYSCTQGKVLYLNLEVDKASFLHRLANVYRTLRRKPDNIGNITIWHLRGKSAPMDKLTPKLLRRAVREGYTAIIIDPIYKVLTGDENSAEQMSRFCNEFDKICNELGCAVIYCHHHSKGNQGAKRSMDRASGSGVFARDPDAMLDLIELEIDENLRRLLENKAVCEKIVEYIKRFHPNDFDDIISPDDMLNAETMREKACSCLPNNAYRRVCAEVDLELKKVKKRTAWRIEGTLREFPKIDPVNCFFDYPIHVIDNSGILADLDADLNSKNSNWKKNFKNKRTKEEKAESRRQEFETHFYSLQSFSEDGKVTLRDLSQQLGKTERTIRGWIENEFEDFMIRKGNVEKIE